MNLLRMEPLLTSDWQSKHRNLWFPVEMRYNMWWKWEQVERIEQVV